jgi:hypothetical protein
LASTAEGQRLNDPDAGDPVLAELNATRDALTGITTRLDTIGPRLAEGVVDPEPVHALGQGLGSTGPGFPWRWLP